MGPKEVDVLPGNLVGLECHLFYKGYQGNLGWLQVAMRVVSDYVLDLSRIQEIITERRPVFHGSKAAPEPR